MSMKVKNPGLSGVQELCRKLKLQLDELTVVPETDRTLPDEEKSRRNELMEQLKRQLAELSQ